MLSQTFQPQCKHFIYIYKKKNKKFVIKTNKGHQQDPEPCLIQLQ